MAPAIVIDNLSKRYRIGARVEREDSLRDQIPATLKRVARGQVRRIRREFMWALSDVSLEVEEGEVLGVVGRNGAGKTTLLKVLSRITAPTSGSADLYGRVGSLLEVGTGFHGDLSGRDNVYMNGSILGMRRAEIARKFDEIVEFSGVEKFIDTPVKRYSSGMAVRLAFAVAAHLDTDILLVDEVLSVGDFEFQQKSMGAMRAAAGSGRTVVFVSHNMPAVGELCTRAVLLDHGRVIGEGVVDQVVRQYLRLGEAQQGSISESSHVTGSGELFLRRVVLLDDEGEPVSQLGFGEPVRLRITAEVIHAVHDAAFEIGISTMSGVRLVTVTTVDGGKPPLRLEPGWCEFDVEVETSLLPHEYSLDLSVHHYQGRRQTIDWVDGVLTFHALDVGRDKSDHYVSFTSTYSTANVRGYLRPEATWSEPRQALDPAAASYESSAS